MGNSFFLWTIKKNVNLRRTPHFMLAALAIRDLIVTVAVVPFIIDSQVGGNLIRPYPIERVILISIQASYRPQGQFII